MLEDRARSSLFPLCPRSSGQNSHGQSSRGVLKAAKAKEVADRSRSQLKTSKPQAGSKKSPPNSLMHLPNSSPLLLFTPSAFHTVQKTSYSALPHLFYPILLDTVFLSKSPHVSQGPPHFSSADPCRSHVLDEQEDPEQTTLYRVGDKISE